MAQRGFRGQPALGSQRPDNTEQDGPARFQRASVVITRRPGTPRRQQPTPLIRSSQRRLAWKQPSFGRARQQVFLSIARSLAASKGARWQGKRPGAGEPPGARWQHRHANLAATAVPAHWVVIGSFGKQQSPV